MGSSYGVSEKSDGDAVLKQKYRRMQYCAVGVGILLVGALIAVIVLATQVNTQDPPMSAASVTDQICLSEDCIASTQQLLAHIDQSVDPCDDFYRYSCGKWHEQVSFPADNKIRVNFVSELTTNIARQVRDALEGPVTNAAVIKAKALYDSCMDYESIDRDGLVQLRAFAQVLGGYNFSHPWTVASDWSLQTMVVLFDRLLASPIMSFTANVDLRNTSRIFLQIGAPSIDVSPNFNRTSVVNAAQWQLYSDTLKIFQSDADDDRIEEVLQFLGGLKTVAAMQYNGTFNESTDMTLADLQSVTGLDWINWVELFRLAFNHTISETFVVQVSNLGYFENLGHYLDQWDKSVIQNGFVLSLVRSMEGYLVGDITSPWKNYIRTLISKYNYEEPRWKSCISFVVQAMPKTTRYIFSTHGFANITLVTKQIEDMIDFIKSTAIEDLKKNDWLDESTRAYAIRKASLMEKEVAFPEDVADQAELLKEANGIEVTSSFMLTVTTYWLNIQALVWDLIRKGYNDKSAWNETPLTVNAVYNFGRNKFTILAGILGGAFYNPNHPMFMNYGGIGYIIGHEITHAFDSTGKDFDIYGNKNSWWSEESTAKFEERKACFVEEYPKINVSVSGSVYNVDGNLTADENIADAGGLKYAYLGYEAWLKNNAAELNLPNTALDQWQKAFFTMNAQLWCTEFTHLGATIWFSSDPHSANEARVNGAMMNSQEFQEAFQCPAGSKMNPQRKCKLW